jgi:hypothetical protein
VTGIAGLDREGRDELHYAAFGCGEGGDRTMFAVKIAR